MNIVKDNKLSLLVNFAVGFFFLSVLSVKGGHNFAPFLLIIIAFSYLIYLIAQKRRQPLSQDEKWLIASYVFYFSVFLLSLLLHGGKFRELDNPSRAILVLPLLSLFFHHPIRFKVLAYGIPAGAVIAGLVALYDRFYLGAQAAYSPRTMHIQGGDIAMSLGMFSLVIALYFAARKQYKAAVLCTVASLFGILGSFLSTARGGWIGLPFILAVIILLYRKQLSKPFLTGICSVVIIAIIAAVALPNTQVMNRIKKANNEIAAYFDKNNGATSVGARFDMWKGALLMAQEKPLLGWGTAGVAEQSKQYAAQKIINKHAAIFDHAHNQYLDDLAKRGILGLLGLLGIMLVPMRYFIRSLPGASLEARYAATLGIIHILSVMFYCLSQGFFTHNSGNIFYFFPIMVLFAAVRTLKSQTDM
ncbi:O-antigen ligase family protein [Necropsobacter rosorum]|uniref:O-antigen ligase family protein n=1 Tax=Necropsobacter rosorum TaxID=908285 RepID=UPI0005096D81